MSREKIEELQKLIQKEEAKLQQEATVEVGGSDNFKAEEQATDRTSRQPNLYRVTINDRLCQALRKDDQGIDPNNVLKLKRWEELPLEELRSLADSIAKAYDKERETVMNDLQKYWKNKLKENARSRARFRDARQCLKYKAQTREARSGRASRDFNKKRKQYPSEQPAVTNDAPVETFTDLLGPPFIPTKEETRKEESSVQQHVSSLQVGHNVQCKHNGVFVMSGTITGGEGIETDHGVCPPGAMILRVSEVAETLPTIERSPISMLRSLNIEAIVPSDSCWYPVACMEKVALEKPKLREKEEDKEAKSEGLLHSTLSTHMNTALRQVNEKDRKRFASALEKAKFRDTEVIAGKVTKNAGESGFDLS